MQDMAVEAARFIAEHAHEPIVVADIADHVGYSPFHFARSFQRRLGVPPGQLLAAQRFQRAKHLLLSGDDRIIDVCFAVGFSSVGTFTTRFSATVGVSPTAFRRLPHALTDAPPRPVVIPGTSARGGVVTGAVCLSEAAEAALGGPASVYVGLFPSPSPGGLPISGSLLDDSGEFALTGVPPGTHWLLASALPRGADAQQQLLPASKVVGGSAEPVRVTTCARRHHRVVRLDIAADWSPPVLVALPPLASSAAQDWRRQR